MQAKQFLLITTGGTIDGQVAHSAAHDNALISRDADRPRLDTVMRPTLAHLKEDWNVDVSLTARAVAEVDSSDILPHHWTAMANLVAEHYDAFDGFIITHGTNTLAYTAAALSFALPNLNKPVIVTGSQVPFGRPESDALMNFANALRVAAYPHLGGIRGVVCVFGSYIIAGTRAKKNTEFALDAFQPFVTDALGRIGRIIQINEANLARHHRYLSMRGSPAVVRRQLIVRSEFDTRLLSFTEFPGMSPDLFHTVLAHLVDRPEPLLAGLVFRAFGAGDVSHHLHSCFAYLAENRIPVVVTTQAPNGTSSLMVNDPGRHLIEQHLGIAAYDMNIESITTKLSWLIAQEVPYDDMTAAMQADLHGEITHSYDLT